MVDIYQSDARPLPHARVSGFGFHLPGERIAIADLPLSPDERKRLPGLGQEFTHRSEVDSTALMVLAARDAMERSGVAAADVRLVISAPSLVTGYGLEIPAVAVRAELGLAKAHCMNLAQGCVGVLRGIELAAELVRSRPQDGDIIVVTSCRASGHTQNMNHGAFFWGDAGGAVVVSAKPGPGLEIAAYSEASSGEDWGAMRIACGGANDGMIKVHFATAESQMAYIRGEQERFAAVADGLLGQLGLREDDVEAVFLPSTGKKRVPILFSGHRELSKRIKTDFRQAHFGGVDPILSLHQYLEAQRPAEGAWLMVASPAFAAQWGGLLVRVVG